jgi:hypothetical protein
MSSATSNVTSYPSNRLNRATNFSTMFDTVILPYNKEYNNFIYKPHTAYGMVGTSAAAYLARRNRL